MSEIAAVIETLEHRWMRAWMAGDARELKRLTARNFVMLLGSTPPVILDSTSWLDAAATRFLCSSYRFGPVHVRDFGGLAVFATPVDIQARIAGEEWSGNVWLTDVWRKGRIRRQWRLIERLFSRTEGSVEIPPAVRSLQAWR